MGNRQPMPQAYGRNGKQFPPEAYEFDTEVSPEAIQELREKIGIDFESDEWEVVDGFGRVLPA